MGGWIRSGKGRGSCAGRRTHVSLGRRLCQCHHPNNFSFYGQDSCTAALHGDARTHACMHACSAGARPPTVAVAATLCGPRCGTVMVQLLCAAHTTAPASRRTCSCGMRRSQPLPPPCPWPLRPARRHLDADEASVLGAGLFAANLSTSFRLRKFGMVDLSMYGVSLTFDQITLAPPKEGEEQEVQAGGGGGRAQGAGGVGRKWLGIALLPGSARCSRRTCRAMLFPVALLLRLMSLSLRAALQPTLSPLPPLHAMRRLPEPAPPHPHPRPRRRRPRPPLPCLVCRPSKRCATCCPT